MGLVVLAYAPPAIAQAPTNQHPVNIYLFWGDGCPHCAKAKPVLEAMDLASEHVSLYKYEVYYDATNQELLRTVATKLNIEASGVPVIIIGDKASIGYSDETATLLKKRVDDCLVNGCSDSVADIVGAPKPASSNSQTNAGTSEIQNKNTTITLPFIGKIALKDFSLPIITVIIAALDGFNPCAMWTLLFLISLLLGMKSHRRRWTLGLAFIGASAFMYFAFMAAWLNVFLFIGVVAWIKVVMGLIAVGVGVYYLYDYYTNKDGGCGVTGDEGRQKIFSRIREVARNKNLIVALLGIVILAFAVNLVDLVCSAGLPAIYTNVLSSSGLAPWQHYAYLVLYILIFMADDIFVFLVAMFTLKMIGIQSRYVRMSHLVGGIVMLILGGLLIFAPQLLMLG